MGSRWCGSYLASVSFVDAQVGRVLDALKESGLEKNTVVVLWSDHGWHLGEKGITGKNTLWERSTRVPLIFAGPGVAANAKCDRPAELLDLYPTLLDLCALPANKLNEGLSLVPQLKDAKAARERPAVTTHNPGNHAVRTERWRYIRYADGSEELYDRAADPHEWTNVAAEAKFADVKKELAKWVPATSRRAAARQRRSAAHVRKGRARVGRQTDRREGSVPGEVTRRDPAGVAAKRTELRCFMARLFLALTLTLTLALSARAEPIKLWPGKAPGETKDIGTEKLTEPKKGQADVKRLGNVSEPTITIYAPRRTRRTAPR